MLSPFVCAKLFLVAVFGKFSWRGFAKYCEICRWSCAIFIHFVRLFVLILVSKYWMIYINFTRYSSKILFKALYRLRKPVCCVHSVLDIFSRWARAREINLHMILIYSGFYHVFTIIIKLSHHIIVSLSRTGARQCWQVSVCIALITMTMWIFHSVQQRYQSFMPCLLYQTWYFSFCFFCFLFLHYAKSL